MRALRLSSTCGAGCGHAEVPVARIRSMPSRPMSWRAPDRNRRLEAALLPRRCALDVVGERRQLDVMRRPAPTAGEAAARGTGGLRKRKVGSAPPAGRHCVDQNP